MAVIRDSLNGYCNSVRTYLDAHFEAANGRQGASGAATSCLPLNNFNQNVLSRDAMLKEMFEKYDTDKDGLLNSASYREFLKGIHVWGTGQYNEDEWEFMWPDECGLLKVTHYAPLPLNGTARCCCDDYARVSASARANRATAP